MWTFIYWLTSSFGNAGSMCCVLVHVVCDWCDELCDWSGVTGVMWWVVWLMEGVMSCVTGVMWWVVWLLWGVVWLVWWVVWLMGCVTGVMSCVTFVMAGVTSVMWWVVWRMGGVTGVMSCVTGVDECFDWCWLCSCVQWMVLMCLRWVLMTGGNCVWWLVLMCDGCYGQ